MCNIVHFRVKQNLIAKITAMLKKLFGIRLILSNRLHILSDISRKYVLEKLMNVLEKLMKSYEGIHLESK